MKRIFSFLFAIITLVGTTGVFTSCQEDAPEINYTINITVNNDFTEVVNAINNGTMKQEAAIAALTAAINQMNGDQAAKLQALVEAINSLATTVEAKLAIIEAAMKAQTLALESKLGILTAAVKSQTIKQEELAKLLSTAIDNLSGTLEDKLAAIEAIIESTSATLAEKIAAVEAAMKAQTLSLENKLALLEAAIKALPDYTDQLKAIEAAIKGMPDYSNKLAAIETAIKNIPDYSDKMDAIQTALAAIAEKIEAQEGQYADELAALKTSIDAIQSEVAAGNKSQEDALAEIIALLKSGAIAGGGSGSGGEGEGGEGEGGEDEDPYIAITLSGETKEIVVTYLKAQELPEVEGMTQESVDDSFEDVKHVTYKINSSEVRDLKLKGNITWLKIHSKWITILDFTHMSCLEYFKMNGGQIYILDASKNKNLKEIDIHSVGIHHLKLCKDVPGGYTKINCGESFFDEADLWDEFFASLPKASESAPGELFIYNFENPSKEVDAIKPTDEQIKIAIDKNYKVYKDYNCTELYVVE